MTDGSGEVPLGDELPEDKPPEDNLDRLQHLADTLNQVTTQLGVVAATGNRTRRLAIGLAVSFALDILLTLTVTMLAASALGQGNALHTSQLTSCAISNQTRAEQEQLWVYILTQAAPPKTAAERAADQAFLAHVQETFAPVNCQAVYK